MEPARGRTGSNRCSTRKKGGLNSVDSKGGALKSHAHNWFTCYWQEGAVNSTAYLQTRCAYFTSKGNNLNDAMQDKALGPVFSRRV